VGGLRQFHLEEESPHSGRCPDRCLARWPGTATNSLIWLVPQKSPASGGRSFPRAGAGAGASHQRDEHSFRQS